MKKRTKLIAVYLFLIAVVAIIAYSLAAYTSLSSAKRVVTVRGSEQLFTSDVLVQYDNASKLSTKVKSFGKDDTTRTFSVTISNHLQNDATKFDKNQISYDFKVELVDAGGNVVTDENIYRNITINNTIKLTDGTYTESGTLAAGKALDKTYTFVLTGNEILPYQIKITAEPTNRSQYKPLGRLIVLTTDTTETHWTGSFLETEKSAVEKDEKLGLLNYRISGHVEENCVLSWDSSRVEIDQWFLEQMGNPTVSTAKDGKKKSVTLHLGAAGTPQQYTIQFYRTYAVNDLNEDWNTIKEYIHFKNSKEE